MFWQKKEKNIGLRGEELARKYLKRKGYKIIDSNYQNKIGRRLGEIDIIAKFEEQIIFVEVKSRVAKLGNFILPEENITRDKLHKLEKIAKDYIRENNLWDKAYRFDAVLILFDKDEKEAVEFRHLESIFY